jgi:hypothetical protein
MCQGGVKVRECVCAFWEVYGGWLVAENGPGSFKHELVVKMGDLHGDLEAGIDSVPVDTVRGKIREIVGLQRMHLMQFEFCLDEFNRYLAALLLLDVVLRET